MRFILLLFTFLFFSKQGFSQFFKENQLFIESSISIGNYFRVGGSLNFIYKEKIPFSFQFCGIQRTDQNLPRDFTGVFGGLLYGLDLPKEHANIFLLNSGRSWVLNHKVLRLNLTGGLGVAEFIYPELYIKRTTRVFGANYDAIFASRTSMAVTINTSVDVLIGRYYGVSFGITSIFSKDFTFIGVSFSYLLLGIVSAK